MIININTNLASGTTMTLGLPTTGLLVNWGDGNTDSSNTHTYASNGTYTIQILSTSSTTISLGTPGTPAFITSVTSWGSFPWTSFAQLFRNQTNLTAVPTNLPSTVTNINGMFYGCTSFNFNINNWNTSNVTNMGNVFANTANFNQPLSNWKTGNVTEMRGMFEYAVKFNQPIGNWDVRNVVTFSGSVALSPISFDGGGMFNSAKDFNQPLGNWNTKSATNMGYMFWQATKFNQPLNNWDVSNVTNMRVMFGGNETFSLRHNFNQSLDQWNTSSVIDMNGMFRYSKFNKPIGNWDVSSVQEMTNMFAFNIDFNQPLGTWDVSNVTKMGDDDPDSFGALEDGMFEGATSFNQNLNNWDISSLTAAGRMFKNAASFSPANVEDWDTTGVYIDSWTQNTYDGPAADETIGVKIAVVRESANNRAKITITPTGTFHSYLIYYRLPDVNKGWTLAKSTTKLVDYHTNSEGYLSNVRIEYQVAALPSPFAPPVTHSNVVTLSGSNPIRYISETKPGFRIKKIINNESTNNLFVEFELPKPNTNFSFVQRYALYRITDIKTGRVIGSVKTDGKITNEGANGLLSTQAYKFNDKYPIFLTANTGLNCINIVDKVKNVINLGEKGIKLEWGWWNEKSFTFNKDANNYGIAYFYPKFIETPPEEDEAKPLPEAPDVEIETGKPVVETPSDEDQDTKQVCIYDPSNPTVRICVEADARTDTVCIVESNGTTVLRKCSPLPPGAAPGDLLNVRRDNDYLTIVYDGEVVVTYKIDPTTFPTLANSQGWWGYLDVATDTFTTTPSFTTVDFPSAESGIYLLQARYVDRPLANKRPFIYGNKLQAQTIYFDKNNVVHIEEPVLAQDLVEATKVFENGLQFEIDTETAQAIWNAGGSQYISAVNNPTLEEDETVIGVPEDQE